MALDLVDQGLGTVRVLGDQSVEDLNNKVGLAAGLLKIPQAPKAEPIMRGELWLAEAGGLAHAPDPPGDLHASQPGIVQRRSVGVVASRGLDLRVRGTLQPRALFSGELERGATLTDE